MPIFVLVALAGALLGPAAEAQSRRLVRVPQDEPDLQTAIDNARPGDLILLDNGTYPGGITVPETLNDITIRGVDRNGVVFDGDDERADAIYVYADGVAVENMTAHNFTGNAFVWLGTEGFAGRYLTVYNVGLYGIYAIESHGGRFEHSFVSGAADAAFYVGECDPCDVVLTDLTARLSAVGYSGTNASDVVVRDSRWELNGAGILPNSYDVDIEPPPQADSLFAGNVVIGSGTVPTPANTPLAGFVGIGIGIAGGVGNVVRDNEVADSASFGIATFATVDQTGVWIPDRNRVEDNRVSGSGTADLALARGSGPRNCFVGNEAGTFMPPTLASDRCPLEGSPVVAEQLVLSPPEAIERHPELERAPAYDQMEAPGTQPSMPGALTGLPPAQPAPTVTPSGTETDRPAIPDDGAPLPGLVAAGAVGVGLLVAGIVRRRRTLILAGAIVAFGAVVVGVASS